jgi:hypothetical protein
MSPTRQREVIAIACGWRIKRVGIHTIHVWEPGARLPARLGLNLENKLPNYLWDLNAMRTAEKVLTQEQHLKFRRIAFEIVTGVSPRGVAKLPKATRERLYHQAALATASELAEAFLRTLNLYECDTES